MLRRRTTLATFLALVVLLGSLGFLLSLNQNSDFHLLVQSDHGGSVRIGEDVLLRGEPILSGESIRVVEHPLVLLGSNRRVAMKFLPGSRVRFPRVYPDTGRIRLTVQSGDGVIRLRDGVVRGTIRGDSFQIREGSLRWEIRGPHSFVDSSELARGTMPNPDGHSIHPFIKASLDFGSSLPGAVRLKQSWYLGSLEPGQKIVQAVQSYFARRGHPPERLRDVFGYWVRDRWGQVYLYQTGTGTFSVRSGGPDGAMFSRDDRKWTAPLTRNAGN